MNSIEYRTKQMSRWIQIVLFIGLILYLVFSLKFFFLEKSIVTTLMG